MREPGADLEGTLDRVIGRLSRPGAPREARALLVDARRLLGLVRNWRTISPTEAARAQMLERVEALLDAADVALPPEPEPEALPAPVQRPAAGPSQRAAAGPAQRPAAEAARSPSPSPRVERTPPPRADREPPRIDREPPRVERTPPPRAQEESQPDAFADPFPRRNAARPWDEPPPSLVLDPPAVPARTSPPEDPTRAAPIPIEAQASRERAPARANGAPVDPMRPRTLPDLDISGVAELMEEPPGFPFDEPLDPRRGGRAARSDIEALRRPEPAPRVQPSNTPPQGRRRADMPGEDRPSRLIIDDPETNDGVIYPAGEDPSRATPRPTPRPSPRPGGRGSAPPAGRDKTGIAVRPLPAPEALDRRLVLLNDPYSKRAEAYRTLRRKLSGPGAPRTIAVTSAQAGEGKTTCAVNLALAFRETSHEKVLLIEANLKAPSLATLFGFEPPVCFAKQMARNRDGARASWTVAEQFEPLHVLAVDPASETSPLLDPVAFANALEQLVEAGYDHIIVDTPPALGGSDVNVVADAVDGVVVVAWIKKSKKSLVKQAVDQLKPATILGVVTLEG